MSRNKSRITIWSWLLLLKILCKTLHFSLFIFMWLSKMYSSECDIRPKEILYILYDIELMGKNVLVHIGILFIHIWMDKHQNSSILPISIMKAIIFDIMQYSSNFKLLDKANLVIILISLSSVQIFILISSSKLKSMPHHILNSIIFHINMFRPTMKCYQDEKQFNYHQ